MSPSYRNPVPTVDIIIEIKGGIILIERKNPPFGWALPGGFVDYGESLENAAVRETREETGLDVVLIMQLHTYSAPDRDPRQHTMTTVFLATPINSKQNPKAADDAARLSIFTENNLPDKIAFDHRRIISDYYSFKKGVSPYIYQPKQ